MAGESGEATSWVDRELAGSTFRDKRLGDRLRTLLAQMSGAVGEPIPLACQDWASTKAANRFLANEAVSEAEILSGHFEATRGRATASGGPILVVQDTTEFPIVARARSASAPPPSRRAGGKRTAASDCTLSAGC
jgi:hypothetical protein